ncbi:unnamed protein product [Camellia sinensis]
MLNLFAYIIPYQQLAMMAKPTYSENGKFEDGGFDLILMEFLTTIISEKFWYIYLVGPEDDENEYVSLSGFDNRHVKRWACKKALVKDGHCFEAIELVVLPGESFYNKFKSRVGMPTWMFSNSVKNSDDI